jgi:hypothetical protein
MIDMQLLDGVILAVAVLVGAAILLALGMVAVAAASKPGRGPHGGIRRDPVPHPQPDSDDARETDDARELVLL